MSNHQRDERSREEHAGRDAGLAQRGAARGMHSERSEGVLPEGRPGVISARPIKSARIAYACSAVVLITFVVVAVVMKSDSAGAHFGDKDQIGTAVVGVILAGLCLMPTRPRLVADAEAVRLRSFLGGWRTVPWNLIVRVDFPSKLRFARLVLPGEEALAIYAIQRLDREEAVATMRGLRALFAETHPEAD